MMIYVDFADSIIKNPYVDPFFYNWASFLASENTLEAAAIVKCGWG